VGEFLPGCEKVLAVKLFDLLLAKMEGLLPFLAHQVPIVIVSVKRHDPILRPWGFGFPNLHTFQTTHFVLALA